MGNTSQQTTLNCLQLEAGCGWKDFLFLESFEDGITATPGVSQANARVLSKQNNRITTVATSGDSVKLPIATPGAEVILINHGVNPMQVFGQGSDTINDVASGTGVSQMQNSAVFFLCFSTGSWYSADLANGFVSGGMGGFQTFATQTGVVCTASPTQGNSAPITAMNAQLTGPASGASGFLLPPAKTGMEITIVNNTANATAPTAFASGSDTINGTAGATGVATGANGTITLYFCFAAGAWVTK